MQYDVIIIGGSYAGLSAALPLARARRRVLVVDAGQRRNRMAEHSHGFLTQDGVPPGDIADRARQQLMAYPDVTWQAAQVTGAQADPAGGFRVQWDAGGRARARRLILASGVEDRLPSVPGLVERWGRTVFHCPYCHGYELNQGRIGVLGISEHALHLALMLPDWGATTLFLAQELMLTEAWQEQLHGRGVTVERCPIAGIEERLTLVLQDGRRKELEGLFTPTHVVLTSPVPQQLGCDIEDAPMGQCVRVDALQETSVPGVFACGDLVRLGGSVPLAVGSGAQAGVAAHRSLVRDIP